MADPAQHEAGPRAAPRWCPDPELVNTQRYWDGERWLEHRARATTANEHSDGSALNRDVAVRESVFADLASDHAERAGGRNDHPGIRPRATFANGLWTVTVVFGSLAGLVGLVISSVLRSRK